MRRMIFQDRLGKVAQHHTWYLLKYYNILYRSRTLSTSELGRSHILEYSRIEIAVTRVTRCEMSFCVFCIIDIIVTHILYVTNK